VKYNEEHLTVGPSKQTIFDTKKCIYINIYRYTGLLLAILHLHHSLLTAPYQGHQCLVSSILQRVSVDKTRRSY
jgi:hypothetical protein